MWLAYVAPGSPLRAATSAFSTTIGKGPPRRLFAEFSQGFMLFLYRMERLRLGRDDGIAGLLEIPEQDRLQRLLDDGGVMLVMPHAIGSLSMVRGLSQRFSVLMLVRTAREPRRSASQHNYYSCLGCDILDVRRTSQANVARAVIRALRDGRIVVVTGDLIKKAPPADAPVDKESDLVRAEAFGQPLGAPGWPARLALRAGAPLLPVMVAQTADKVRLHLGQAAQGDDVLTATRHWMAELAALLAEHPGDWVFLFDRRWSTLMQAAVGQRQSSLTQRPAPS